MPTFSDLNIDFPNTLDTRVFDLDAIDQSLEMIFNITPSEVFFDPEFGSNVQDTIFELIDQITADQVLVLLVTAVERWDNRIVVDWPNSKIDAVKDFNRYILNLAYKIRGLTDETFVYSSDLVQSNRENF